MLGVPAGELPDDRAGRALAVYRAYVGEVVGTASPLLLRVCDLEGVDLDVLTLKLRPGLVWEQWLCGVRPYDA